MPMLASYIAEEDRLDLSFEGNLDVTVWGDVCDICQRVEAGLKSCIVDLSNVEGIFDSGVAMLLALYRRMTAVGTTVVFLSDRPDIRERFPVISCRPRQVPSLTSLGVDCTAAVRCSGVE